MYCRTGWVLPIAAPFCTLVEGSSTVRALNTVLRNLAEL
jgi:hypothetical protein